MSDLVATYRLQLGPHLDFAAAAELVPYLADLGVSHLYLSPIWQARAGSSHGYDVTDPARVSRELGGEDGFAALSAAGLGIVLDVVPNHMVADEANHYWADPARRARFFDIDERTGFCRRFFDVDDLVGVRVEDEDVFAATHAKVRELVAAQLADGIRVDHIDGLADPAQYLERLAALGAAHVWVEKILEPGEALRDWPVEGTTGYDFLNDVTALFVEPSAAAVLDALLGARRPFRVVAAEAKLEQAAVTFAPEVDELWSVADVPGIAEALAALPVYRTYARPGRAVEDEDRTALDALPAAVRAAFFDPATPPAFITRFQQTSGAVMAKGVEDTALYRDVRLLALNEVGGDPDRFGISVEEFHARNEAAVVSHPRSLLASHTHDAKRSGDVRARLVGLTWLADEWASAVREWHGLRAPGESPDWAEENFVYQTLVAGWPIDDHRLAGYLTKSLREAKRHTSWTDPDAAYESRVIEFATSRSRDDAFLRSFLPLARRLAELGERIALAQLVLKMTSPGIPDIYQGDEDWNLSFVDPDNRRPVAWAPLRRRLAALRGGAPVDRSNAKCFVTATLLAARRRMHAAFAGGYERLVAGPGTCAFVRGGRVAVAVAVRNGDADVELPGGSGPNVLAPLALAYPGIGIHVSELP